MSKKWMTPYMRHQIGNVMRIAHSVSQGGQSIAGKPPLQAKDYGSNQERQKVISENEHIYRKNVEDLLENGKIELMPRKAKRLLEWLDLNHNEFFLSLDVNELGEKVEILLDR